MAKLKWWEVYDYESPESKYIKEKKRLADAPGPKVRDALTAKGISTSPEAEYRATAQKMREEIETKKQPTWMTVSDNIQNQAGLIRDFFDFNKENTKIEMFKGLSVPDFSKVNKLKTDSKVSPNLLAVMRIAKSDKTVYKYKRSDPKTGASIISQLTEIKTIGENEHNYFYSQNGKIMSVSKEEVTEQKLDKEKMEELWMHGVNKIIETERGTTAQEEKAIQEEIKTQGIDALKSDVRYLMTRGYDPTMNEIPDSPAQIRKAANEEREKEQSLWDRAGQGRQRFAEVLGRGLGGEALPADKQIETDQGAVTVPGLPSTGNDTVDTVINLLGLGGSFGMSPGGGASATIGQATTKTAAFAEKNIIMKLTKYADKLKNPVAKKILGSTAVAGAIEGAAMSAPLQAIEQGARDLTPQQRLEKLGTETAIMAGAGAVLKPIASGISKTIQKSKTKSALKKINKLKPLAGEAAEQETKKEVKGFAKAEWNKKYGLDEDLSKLSRTERIKKTKAATHKLLDDTGDRIIKKVGSDKPDDILNYYKTKYNITEKLTLKPSLKQGYAKISKGRQVISYNPNMPKNRTVGAIRHEIEHFLDSKKYGFEGTERKMLKGYKSVDELYRQPGHHKYYDYFESDYLRKAMAKDAIASGETVPKSIIEELGLAGYKPPPESLQPVFGPKGNISKFQMTVREASTTTSKFKGYLEKQVPKEYQARINQQDWDSAVNSVNDNASDVWTKVRSKKGNLTAEDSHQMMALIELHERSGNYAAATEVLDHLTTKATESGQFIQALSVWERRTPEGMLKYASTKISNAFKTTQKGQKLETVSKEVKDLRSTIESLQAKQKGLPRTSKQFKNIQNKIELNMRDLVEREKDVRALENITKGKLLQPKDAEFIAERMTNYKSKDFYKGKFKEYIKEHGSESISKMRKGVEYAERQRIVELTRALNKIADLTPSSTRDKLRALQRISMLSNARTVSRNITSNAVMSTLDMGFRENTIAPIIDYISAATKYGPIKPLTQKAGRTTVFAPIRKGIAYAKGFKKGLVELAQDIKDSKVYGEYIDTSTSRGFFEAKRGTTFKGTNIVSKTLNKMDNFVKRIVTDRPFLEAAKQSRLEELKILDGVKKNTAQHLELANLYALDKVFQNDSALSRTLTLFRKKVPGSELIMPFTQTPANLMDKLVDYSGGGLVKALVQLGQKGKGFDQKLFVDRISRTFSGAGVMAIAYGMAKKGLLTGRIYSSSEKKTEYQLAKGMQPYSFKIGDKYYSYDWLTPVGSIFSAVADYHNQAEKDDTMIEDIISTPINTVLNQSFMGNLIDVFSGYSSTGGITYGIIKGFAGASTQVVPTGVKQIGEYMDPYQRETKDESLGQAIKNRMIKALPGKRETLEPKIDVFGRPVSYKTGEKLKDFISVFLAPANVRKETKNTVINELDTLISHIEEKNKNLPKSQKIESTTAIMPRNLTNNIEFSGNKIKLNDKQLTKYKKLYGKMVSTELEELFNTDKYQRWKPEKRIEKVQELYAKVNLESKYDMLKSLGYKVYKGNYMVRGQTVRSK